MNALGAATLCLGLLLLSAAASQAEPLQVPAASRPGRPWKDYPTRTLSEFPENVTQTTDTELTRYGGRADRKAKATGFFYTLWRENRWWLVDPDGGLFLHKGVVAVSPLRTQGAQAEFAKAFGNNSRWAVETTFLLRTNGFNGVGAWSDTDSLRNVPRPLVYTRIWNFMSSYGRKRGGTYQLPGHTGYPSDCIFVFDPAFEKFCQEHARQLTATKTDPWLLGHFSDNELPFKTNALNNYLELPETDPGHQAAARWLYKQHGTNATSVDITTQDQMDFLRFLVDRYFQIVSRAIKKADPNHLFLGSRFHGSDLRLPEVFAAAGPYLDVVSVNYYGAWTPSPERLAMWTHQAGKPVLITEWYAKGMDSSMANTGGAGWLVKTQRDRGLFYENFVLGLLESRSCVGWHWFKYTDNDPLNFRADFSNQDSNKGILNNRYQPYPALLESMKRVNDRSYRLIDYFDNQAATTPPSSP